MKIKQYLIGLLLLLIISVVHAETGCIGTIKTSKWSINKATLAGGVAQTGEMKQIGDKLYMFGGATIAQKPLKIIQTAPVSDPLNWSDTGHELPIPMAHSVLVTVGDTMYLYGGLSDDAFHGTSRILSAPVSDPLNWTDTGKQLPFNITRHLAFVTKDTLYFVTAWRWDYVTIPTQKGSIPIIWSAPLSDPTNVTDTGSLFPDEIGMGVPFVIGDYMYIYGGYQNIHQGIEFFDTIYRAPLSSPLDWKLVGKLPIFFGYSTVGIQDGEFIYLLGSYLYGEGFINDIYRAPLNDPTNFTKMPYKLPVGLFENKGLIINDQAYIFGSSSSVDTDGTHILTSEVSTENCFTDIDSDNDGIIDLNEKNKGGIPRDTDNDGVYDHLDLDSDNDGIPDNIEAQASVSYIPPSGIDSDNDGLDDAYDKDTTSVDKNKPELSIGLIAVDTDNDYKADYLDLDSDNDELLDIVESGFKLKDTNHNGMTDNPVGKNGLDNTIDTIDDYSDVGAKIDNPLSPPYLLSDDDNNAALGIPLISDLDFRQRKVEVGLCDVIDGETSEVNIAIDQKVKTNGLLIVPSTIISPSSGHIRAFKVDKTGQKSSEALWDAASKMTSNKRKNSLMSSVKGTLTLLNDLSAAHLDVSTNKQANIIKQYTFTPSFDNGRYLAGRDNQSLLGRISRGNALTIISNVPKQSLRLNDSAYRDFSKQYIIPRKKQVLFSSDDGFLYSVDYLSGALFWGWMPPTIAKELKHVQQFQNQHWMKGTVSVVEAKGSSGNYSSYIVGSYKSGLGHYVLQYDETDTVTMQLKSVIRDNDLSADYVSSPQNGIKTFFYDRSGKLYMAFTLIKSNGDTTLFIQSVTDHSIQYKIALKGEVTSELLMTKDYQSRYAPLANTLYLGLKNGHVISASLLSSTGLLNTQSLIKQQLKQTPIAAMQVTQSSGITHMGIVKQKGRYYLRTQTDNRLTIHRYNYTEKQWYPLWTSFAGGAGRWDNEQNYRQVVNSLASIQGGHPIKPIQKSVQGLPNEAIISAEAHMLAGNIVLPLSTNKASYCYGYYYLFSLIDGSFPQSSFKTLAAGDVMTHLALGKGIASSLELVEFPQSGKLISYANVDQNHDGSVGVPETLVIDDLIGSGVRSWRIIE